MFLLDWCSNFAVLLYDYDLQNASCAINLCGFSVIAAWSQNLFSQIIKTIPTTAQLSMFVSNVFVARL